MHPARSFCSGVHGVWGRFVRCVALGAAGKGGVFGVIGFGGPPHAVNMPPAEIHPCGPYPFVGGGVWHFLEGFSLD